MKRMTTKTILMTVLLMLLIVAVAFGVSCTKPQGADEGESAGETISLGDGDKSFSFSVTHSSGEVVHFTVHTDRETVGEALQELHVIEGEEGPYGLYVKRVNSETLDFDEDGMYWAFYVDEAYAVSGVDKTEIEEGKSYSFRAEKG